LRATIPQARIDRATVQQVEIGQLSAGPLAIGLLVLDGVQADVSTGAVALNNLSVTITLELEHGFVDVGFAQDRHQLAIDAGVATALPAEVGEPAPPRAARDQVALLDVVEDAVGQMRKSPSVGVNDRETNARATLSLRWAKGAPRRAGSAVRALTCRAADRLARCTAHAGSRAGVRDGALQRIPRGRRPGVRG
jgi:hypothetical protein